MRPSQIGMVFVLVPAGVKTRVRVGVVDAEPIVWVLSIPLDGQFRRIRACRGIQAGRIESCPQLLCLDIVRNVLDGRDLWNTVEDVSVQLGVEVGVRITTQMWDRHSLAAGLSGLCRRREEVPFADGEADDLDTPLEVLPLAGDLTALIFLISGKGLVSERPTKLVR